MEQRKTRRFPIIKLLMATGVLGGGGAGVYQFSPAFQTQGDSAAQAGADDATLDQAAAAWQAGGSNTAASVPDTPLPPNPYSESPLAQAQVAESRYGPLSAPLPLPTSSETITRGQDTVEEPEGTLPGLPQPPNALRSNATAQPMPANPLRTAPQSRYANGSNEAREAFDQQQELSAPPAAVAAFNDAKQADPYVHPVSAEEEIPVEAPTAPTDPPLPVAPSSIAGLPMAPGTEEPLAAPDEELMAPQNQPAPFTADAGVGLPPMPAASAPNPLRAAPPTLPAPVTDQPMAPMPAPAPVLPGPPPTTFQQPQPEPMAALPSPSPMASVDRTPRQPLGAGSIGSGRPGDRLLEGRQQPSIAIQKFAPPEIQVGKPCKFLVKVRNVGQRPAADVVVRDVVPSGVQLLATAPQAEIESSNVRWAIGTLSPGEERTLEMEVTPVEEGELGSVATVTFTGEASVRTRCTKPQLAIRMTAPSKVMVGQEQRIQIEIKNPGTGDATGVVIMENVPENLRHAAGPTLEFDVGTLRAGETRTLFLDMIAESPGKVVNQIAAQADGNLQVDQKVEFEVVAPELKVALKGPKQRYLDRKADYTVTIDNPGTATAKDVRLVTKLPRGLKFVKANNYGEYDANSHSVYWSLAELPAGQDGAVQLTALAVSPGDHKLQVQGQAQSGLKAEATHATRVQGIAALKFTVQDLEDPIEVGGQTEYEVRVENQGTKAATNVTVQASVPEGVRIVSAKGDSRHRVQAGVVQFDAIGQLAPRAAMTFRIRVQGIRAGDHRLTVEVNSDDLQQPVRKEESTRVFGDE